jgi:ubiquinone/menaquinone biosynthesis C-methylase UbiE
MRHLDGTSSVQGHVSPNTPGGESTGFVSDDSFRNGGGRTVAPTLPFTGERIVPGMVGAQLFREHEVRYVFAGKFVKDKRVLDVACGSGIGTDYLLKAGARSCLGLDIDRGAIEYARAVYKGCDFVQCDAASLCLLDGTVDAVVSFETIEHVKDQTKFLLECRRVLRPGGILVCSTPNRTLYRWEEDNPFHFQELTVAEFSELLKTVFAEVQLYAQGNRTYPLYVARKVLLSLLKKLEVDEPVKRFLRGKPAPEVPKTEFGTNSSYLDGEIVPYRSALLIQPAYVISVGRKPLR